MFLDEREGFAGELALALLAKSGAVVVVLGLLVVVVPGGGEFGCGSIDRIAD